MIASDVYDPDLEATHWWFTGRRVIVQDAIIRAFPELPHLNILEVGCGTGGNLPMLGHFGQVTGVDISPEAVEYCRAKGLPVNQGTVYNLPYPDFTYDLVVALDVLEHLEDDVMALRELERLIKPGGKLIVTVPGIKALWGPHDQGLGHHRRYNKGELEVVLNRGRLHVDRVASFLTVALPLMWAYRQALRLSRFRERYQPMRRDHPLVNALMKMALSVDRRIMGLELPGASLLAVADPSHLN